MKTPVERGCVSDWNDLEKLYHHLFFNELRVSPGDHNVLLSEKSRNPRGNREKIAQIMFETFASPGN